MVRIGKEIQKSQRFLEGFLTGLRGAVPLANEQIGVMMKLIVSMELPVRDFLDLGCGEGLLSAAVLEHYPGAHGVLLDFSEPMLKSAREKLRIHSQSLVFVNSDYSDPRWVDSVKAWAPFDVVVSGFSIHHQPDERKKSLYLEVYDLLRAGGMFINLDQVSPRTKWIASIWRSYFVDHLYEENLKSSSGKSIEQISSEFFADLDRRSSNLAPVENQCEWLREIGFDDVDCYFKVFESSIFGGRRHR
ncbi:MAG TPA: class I SAM-dependent methyltransferase [Candidatus Bathyarchaeia archaeon]|nr:class I SAM-dependent methyltransferase [Candidatus Bathyarchaeia archaeon]